MGWRYQISDTRWEETRDQDQGGEEKTTASYIASFLCHILFLHLPLGCWWFLSTSSCLSRLHFTSFGTYLPYSFFSVSCVIFGSGFVMTFLFSLSFINYIGCYGLGSAFFWVLFHSLISSYNFSYLLPPTTYSSTLIHSPFSYCYWYIFSFYFFSFGNSYRVGFSLAQIISFFSTTTTTTSTSHFISHLILYAKLAFCFSALIHVYVFSEKSVFVVCHLCFYTFFMSINTFANVMYLLYGWFLLLLGYRRFLLTWFVFKS